MIRSALIFGGAASGKSVFAERLAEHLSSRRVYIATAEALDTEMEARIAAHQSRRGAGWRTLDAPRGLDRAIAEAAEPGAVVLIDCLTLWLSNEILCDDDADLEQLSSTAVEAIASAPCPVIAVSNELGLGLVPETRLGRRFREEQGRLNQKLASAVDLVVFVAAGLPLVLKGESPL